MKELRTLLTTLALVGLVALAGCGQSGPLYLPGNPSEVREPAAQPPPPPVENKATSEDDEEDEDERGNDR